VAVAVEPEPLHCRLADRLRVFSEEIKKELDAPGCPCGHMLARAKSKLLRRIIEAVDEEIGRDGN
jgi:hypothetical protein